MSLNKIRACKIEQLKYLAHTEAEKETVIKAGMEICDAESDELACKIAAKYREQLCSSFHANIVDVIALLLKGGHIKEFTRGPQDVTYLLFIPVPDPPNKKTFIAHITKKQFDKLCNKGIITHRKQMQHTDSRGFCYSHYQLAEEIILRFKGE